MAKAFADYSESELIATIKAHWAQFYRSLGCSSKVELVERPDLTRFSCAVPRTTLNGVVRTRLAPERVDAAIEETIAHFESRDVPAFSWWLMPDMQPADLGGYLKAHGFELGEGTTGMAIDLDQVSPDPPFPAGLRIQVVGDKETCEQWTFVAATCFDMTGFEEYLFDWWMDLGFDLSLRHYLGLSYGEPVATSTLILAAGVAGLYIIGVLPDARGRGIGTAMTLAPLLDARARGYRVGVLHASPMGYNVYRRIGFHEYCEMSHYVWKRESGDVT